MPLREDCMYCQKGEELTCQLLLLQKTNYAEIYLNLNQSYTGRCVVVFPDKHVSELFHLNDDERNGFMGEVSRTAAVIQKLFNPDKINYTIYGDNVNHLHFHVVPKYKGAHGWGIPFSRLPDPGLKLSELELSERVALFHCELGVLEDSEELLCSQEIRLQGSHMG